MARLGVPVGGRVRKLRAVGDQPGRPLLGEGNERVWMDCSDSLEVRRSLDVLAGGNPALKAFGYSDVTGITFALLPRFRELVWIGLGLLCMALVGGRLVAIQDGRTHDSGNDS
jgi:hypothetical protein